MDQRERYRDIERRKRQERRKRKQRFQLIASLGLVLAFCLCIVIVIWARGSGDSEAEAIKAAESGSVVEDEKIEVPEGSDASADAMVASDDAGTESEEEVTDESTVVGTSEALIALEEEIEEILSQTDGVWSVYVKNLETNETLSINNQRMYAASLIKLFVMEATYVNMDVVEANAIGSESSSGSNEATSDSSQLVLDNPVIDLLAAMIQVSDNESYNELVRLESDTDSFSEGCQIINDYLETTEYDDTRVYHTLSPSNTTSETISDIKNHTSVEDCGAILEKIYRGTCVSEEASQEMLEYLLNQQTVSKIPAGVPDGITVANKTGETDESQHDAAIVFGEETDYILCIMSSYGSTAIYVIQDISQVVYEYLN